MLRNNIRNTIYNFYKHFINNALQERDKEESHRYILFCEIRNAKLNIILFIDKILNLSIIYEVFYPIIHFCFYYDQTILLRMCM